LTADLHTLDGMAAPTSSESERAITGSQRCDDGDVSVDDEERNDGDDEEDEDDDVAAVLLPDFTPKQCHVDCTTLDEQGLTGGTSSRKPCDERGWLDTLRSVVSSCEDIVQPFVLDDEFDFDANILGTSRRI
jgi:hypothetical protein